MKALDLFCGGGGSAMGLHRAGIDEIVGVDIVSQPNYPFEFVQADATALPVKDVSSFDLIWASPPCQAYSWSAQRWGKAYPDTVQCVRDMLLQTGKPFVIENVPTAPIRRDLYLTGGMFGLNIERRRHFELFGFRAEQPKYKKHAEPLCTVAGHGGSGRSYKYADWCSAMGINWMTKVELTQAVPPIYAEYIGKAFVATV